MNERFHPAGCGWLAYWAKERVYFANGCFDPCGE